MYDTIIDMLEDIALSKYPIKQEEDESTGIKKTIWVENEYEFSLIFDPSSERRLSLQSKQINVDIPPAVFEFTPDRRNGRLFKKKEMTEALGRELFKDFTIVVRKEGYLGLYGIGSNWTRIIDENEFVDKDE